MNTIMKFVHPGETCVGDDNTEIHTILGSCVAFVAWHPLLKKGGLSHFMLPHRQNRPSPLQLDGKYAEDALDLLDMGCRNVGAGLHECQIKLFGGGDMFQQGIPDDNSKNIGWKNVEYARTLLQKRQLSTVSEHLGGQGYRRLKFDVATGFVWVRFRPATSFAMAA